nr:uncharacterized protein LOC109151076 [Ipomoea batatas]
MAQISVGPNKKQLFMTGQLCKTHDDCKANSVYSGNFCINKMSGSEMGHCVGFGSTLVLPSETKKSKPILGCGKCETDEDCRDCPATAASDQQPVAATSDLLSSAKSPAVEADQWRSVANEGGGGGELWWIDGC